MHYKRVYHASNTFGLKIIKPEKSTHGKAWVYATPNIEVAALFIGRNFDFICTLLTRNGRTCIIERFEGAFDYAYNGFSGVIYVLPSDTFQAGKTGWSQEVVSVVPVQVIDSIIVKDAKEYIEKFIKAGKLKFYQYPTLPPDFPRHKEDIIQKAVNWTKRFGEETLYYLEKFHPDIVDKVLALLNK